MNKMKRLEFIDYFFFISSIILLNIFDFAYKNEIMFICFALIIFVYHSHICDLQEHILKKKKKT